MSQTAAVFSSRVSFQIELPDATEEVLPGVKWGCVEAFPSPAYWAYQAFARRLSHNQVRSRLGDTFSEEVAACLLGGYGIPAVVGLAAFQHLKAQGLLRSTSSEIELLLHLLQPIEVNGRMIRYRFARQKSKYLSEALKALQDYSIEGRSC